VATRFTNNTRPRDKSAGAVATAPAPLRDTLLREALGGIAVIDQRRVIIPAASARRNAAWCRATVRRTRGVFDNPQITQNQKKQVTADERR